MGIRRRKGSLEETLSYALHRDNPDLFHVTYRDKNAIKTDTLNDFMKREDLTEIPTTRILTIVRKDLTVWKKGQKLVLFKKR